MDIFGCLRWSRDEALLAARLFQCADIELVPTRSLLESATQIAIDTDHPAYDCVYVALAAASGCRFVTADDRLVRKLGQGRQSAHGDRVVSLAQAADPSVRP